jgi:hypothetical protein
MINKDNATKIQQISDAYAKLVKRETGASMVCMWGAIDPNSKKIATGMSMSDAMRNEDMTDVYFFMQRNLFLNLYDKNER